MDQYVFPFSNLGDSDLGLLINDNPVHSFPLHVIDDLIYKPFKYYDCDNATNNLTIECNTFEPTCNYLFCDDNNIEINDSVQTTFNLLAIISSLPLHLDSFVDQCLNVCKIKYDIVGFCETRLNDAICDLYRRLQQILSQQEYPK